MRRIKLEVAYDGTNYHGWQVQPGKTTIEGVVNKALSELLQEDITVIGASRTDSGVHAKGNVAVFNTVSRIPPEKICYALNRYLPWDIRAQSSVEVPLWFHPRKVESKKTYEYKIINRNIAVPTERLYSHFVYYDMDIGAMEEAAGYLVGEHDFKSFCSVNTQVSSTVRRIYKLQVEKEGYLIKITVCGNGFLYNMVRIIVGTLIEVGRGRIAPKDMVKILKGLDRSLAGPTAPAHGLTLSCIEYDMNQIFKE
ncbi:tRNA pseudouridine(38-40) synthase TruA [Herbinix luporum]|mgnify:CR=1 FL=1|jgi:tRNA pseudouridine38-40 synthase|uniref:tRNA pseudouridine synthase A n=1 Tax=Herbinix luporum TaxID=1679721 RepID=A0A0K8J3K7_9FIRM|nr:tRNA pseudouridine(38-40) synthase TruA [Herbinix luporum]MDI9489508.1 tRNA pseudouridine(38-40) synthase TruA [Bacillota bacterium]CUH91903.1 tRNA pseudouridine synthase A [Herbinix luporum]HHT57151.1 tRNA pseudouridine(38-40) synthase TruA [Herbinix luporum]